MTGRVKPGLNDDVELEADRSNEKVAILSAQPQLFVADIVYPVRPVPAGQRRQTTPLTAAAPLPSSASIPGTGSRSHPPASAGGKTPQRTSNRRTGCSRNPRRIANKRGGGGPEFPTGLS